jgi:hypothetical protein
MVCYGNLFKEDVFPQAAFFFQSNAVQYTLGDPLRNFFFRYLMDLSQGSF